MLTHATKILMVEDLPVMKKIITHLLKQLSLTNVDVADNGMVALGMLRKKEYDLVLSDWNMPEMDGLALLKAIRGDPALQHLPFILITVEGDEAKVKEAIDAGVNNYIVKPLTTNILRQKLLQTLR
jgi:two-component system, chemotaxis family, chemotaxis protein CheY